MGFDGRCVPLVHTHCISYIELSPSLSFSLIPGVRVYDAERRGERERERGEKEREKSCGSGGISGRRTRRKRNQRRHRQQQQVQKAQDICTRANIANTSTTHTRQLQKKNKKKGERGSLSLSLAFSRDEQEEIACAGPISPPFCNLFFFFCRWHVAGHQEARKRTHCCRCQISSRKSPPFAPRRRVSFLYLLPRPSVKTL